MSFKTLQHEFSRHLKGEALPESLQHVEPRRLHVYRELFFNNVKGFIDSAFPVLHSLYSDADWEQEIRAFWRTHDCQTPYFLGIAEEFLVYLAEERDAQASDYPFMLELAHYEWVELAIATRKTSQSQGSYAAWLENEAHEVALSELAWPLSYRFPVQHISQTFCPSQPSEQGVFLIVYRDSDDEVRFMEINGLTAQMLHLIQQEGHITSAALKSQLIELLPQFDIEQIRLGVDQMLTKLGKKGILVRKK